MEKFCSRVERGATACMEQCKDCRDRQAQPEKIVEAVGVPQAEQEANVAEQQVKVVEMPQATAEPQLQGRIVVSLYANGNAQVDGPFEDRILFHGLLFIAGEVEREMYAKRRAADEARARMLATETRWQKFKRLRRERDDKLRAERMAEKARKAAEQAAMQAAALAVAPNDELSKSLVK